MISILEYVEIQEMNEHGRAKICGLIQYDKKEEYIRTAMKETWVKVLGYDEKGEEKALFYGILTEFHIRTEGKSCILDLTLYTGSRLMDYGKHIRSFQKAGYTYKKIAECCNEGYQETDVKDETLRVTFDMDGEEGKWFYPWRPETGNALYAMPEAGTKVSVYFMNHNEGRGIAVRCSGQPPENQKSKDKSMTTPEKAKIELFTGSLNIKKGKDRLALNDSSNISFSSDRIEIEANGKVKLKAKQISLEAASEIKATTE